MNQRQDSNMSEFTDDEIREQLNCLGFKNVPKDKFYQFKSELEKLISQEMSLNTTSNTLNDLSQSNRRSSSNKPNENLGLQIKNPTQRNFSKKVTFPDNDFAQEDQFESPDQSFASVSTTSSIVNNKLLKRKILRKTQKQTDPEHDLIESFENLRNPSHFENDYEEELNQIKEENDSQYSADEDKEHYIKLNDCYAPINYPMKSFIRSHRSHSALSARSDISSIKSFKSNPVNKYHEYKKMWNKYKQPGEKSHSELRWSIREQMLEKHVIIKKQPKVHAPNSYLIPTDKKRQELRWAVRSALANPFYD